MAYEVIMADLEKDRNEILNFWAQQQKKALDAKFLWIYLNNPDGKALLFKANHNPSGVITGMSSLFPRQFFINAQVQTCAVAGDFLVHYAHRTLGPAIVLQRNVISCAQKGALSFVYGFPNKAAEVVMKRIGYKKVGQMVRFTWIIRTEKALQRRRIPKVIAKAVAPFLDYILKLLATEKWQTGTKSYSCCNIKEIDYKFDLLNNVIKNRYPVVGHRSSLFMKWKYQNDPDAQYEILGLYNRDKSRLLGYVIYRLENNRAEVHDFILSDYKNANRLLISSLLNNARKVGIEAVSFNFIENKQVIEQFLQFGFLKRTKERSVFLYSENDNIEGVDLLNCDNWFITIGDQDT